jgi:hypothetical protein
MEQKARIGYTFRGSGATLPCNLITNKSDMHTVMYDVLGFNEVLTSGGKVILRMCVGGFLAVLCNVNRKTMVFENCSCYDVKLQDKNQKGILSINMFSDFYFT